MVETFQDLRRRAEALLECAPPSARSADASELTREILRAELAVEEQRNKLQLSEFELAVARAQYRELCDFAPIGYLVIGPNGISESNQVAARLLDTSPEQLLGHDFATFVAEDDRADFRDHQRAVRDSAEARTCELALLTRGGARCEVRLHSMRVGGTGSYRIAILDVSDEKRLEKQLFDRTSQDELSPTLRGLVHDLKHVLMTVVAITDRVLTRTSDDAARQLMVETKRVALHGGTMIRQALERPRESTGDIADVNTALQHMEPLLRQLAGSAVQVDIDLDATLATVNVSRGELVQLVSNLVVNARDAMPAGGTLTITTRDTMPPAMSRRKVEMRDYVAVFVSDTGVGMSQEARAHAFEPYFTTKPDGQGTGLGLSTVYSIVKRAGGDVHIQSEIGAGTTVCIQLPRYGSAPARRRLNTPVPLGDTEVHQQEDCPEQSRPRILVVEDDAATLLAYEELLSLQGFEVVSASFATEAISLFNREPGSYLALICDLELRDLDGTELVRRLREVRSDLPVIVVSGMMPNEPLVKQVLLHSGCEVLMKPIEIARLAQRLQRIRAKIEPSPLSVAEQLGSGITR